MAIGSATDSYVVRVKEEACPHYPERGLPCKHIALVSEQVNEIKLKISDIAHSLVPDEGRQRVEELALQIFCERIAPCPSDPLYFTGHLSDLLWSYAQIGVPDKSDNSMQYAMKVLMISICMHTNVPFLSVSEVKL